MEQATDKTAKRSSEIARQYFAFLDRHIDDVISGHAAEFMELNHIARELAVSHKHLIYVIRQETGHHPCHFYDARIIGRAQQLLSETDLSIAQIALTLTYDPSNFSKFFRKWTGITPGAFRDMHKK